MNKIRVIVDERKYTDGQWVQLMGSVFKTGISIVADVSEVAEDIQYYAEFDTEEEAAVWKLTYL